MKAYNYATREAASAHALIEWTFESYVSCKTSVLPDGCRDLIVREDSHSGISWFISDLRYNAYEVPTSLGTHIQGIRLKPGVMIRKADLDVWLKTHSPDLLRGSDQLDDFCAQSSNLSEALDCLASGIPTVSCAARELGVSTRSLQRLIKSETDQTPQYWFALARVRQAGRCLVKHMSLSEIAFENGFADQAHMTREMKNWFKLTPGQSKKSPETRDLMLEPGYG